MNYVDEHRQDKLDNNGAPKRMGGLDKTIAVLDKVGVLSRWVNIIGVGILFLMVVLTFVNVVLRKFFNSPIIGVVEITEVLMIVAIFLAVAHTQNKKAHISVDIITNRLAPRPKLIMEAVHNLLAAAMFVIVIWQVYEQMLYFIQKNSQHSHYFNLPDAPFAGVIIFGCILLTLLLIRDFLVNIREALQTGLKPYQWFLMFGVPIIMAVLAFFWMQPNLWSTDKVTVGIIGIIVSLLFFLAGFPIAYSLFLVSFTFIGHVRGVSTALSMLGTDMFRTPGSYSWSVLPFFVFMGFTCLYAKFGDDLFKAAFKWIGHRAGGMAVATVGACAAFGAIVGDSVAATATMSAVAVPQMKEVKYDDRLTAGCIVGGASLGPIIPPSVIFIMFGLLTGASISDLFIAGIIPGLIMALCFMAIIMIWCRLNPRIGPGGERSDWKTRLVSLQAVGPVVVLFIVVIGGIYAGVFTPTEGGAIGGVIALILGLIARRFTLKRFAETLLESGNVIAMTFLILIASQMFTRLIAWCNVSTAMKTFIINLGLSSGLFVVAVLAILVFLGCFIDGLALVLITIPIFYPIAASLGIEPLWFLVLAAISLNLGNLTPPVGINLFVLKGMRKEIPMGDIYKGALPFVCGTIITLAILFAIPSLVTWLPAVLRKL